MLLCASLKAFFSLGDGFLCDKEARQFFDVFFCDEMRKQVCQSCRNRGV